MLHLFFSRLAHRGRDVRLYGALVGTYFDNLHLHAEFVEQTLEKWRHAAKTVDIDRAYGVEGDAVGGSGYHIVALAVIVRICINPFAAHLEIHYGINQFLAGSHTHCAAGTVDIQSFDSVIFRCRLQCSEHIFECGGFVFGPLYHLHEIGGLVAFGYFARQVKVEGGMFLKPDTVVGAFADSYSDGNHACKNNRNRDIHKPAIVPSIEMKKRFSIAANVYNVFVFNWLASALVPVCRAFVHNRYKVSGFSTDYQTYI